MAGGVVLDVALHSVPRLPTADHPIASQRRSPGAEPFTVEAGEDRFGAVLVNRDRSTRLAVGLAVDCLEELDHVDPAGLQGFSGGGQIVPRTMERRERLDQLIHLRAKTRSMPDGDRRAGDTPKDRHVLARIPEVAHARPERSTIVARFDDDAGPDVIVRPENRLPVLQRRLDADVVTVVETAPNVRNPVERGRTGFDQSENIVGRVRNVTLGHSVADNREGVTTEQTVERGAKTVRAGQGKLVHREIELVANRLDHFVANDRSHGKPFKERGRNEIEPLQSPFHFYFSGWIFFDSR